MQRPGTVLITGGNGNLGRLVAARLEEQGARIVSFDLPGTDTAHSLARHAVVSGDIRDTALLRKTLATHRPDAIIHLASLLSGSSEADPALAWEVNATASVALMRLALEMVQGPFVFASTIATYGPNLPDPLPLDAPQWPENIYGATKVAVERMGVYLRRKQGFDFRCLRFPMVLSPFAPATALTAYPSHAFRAAIAGLEFTFPVAADTGMSTLFLDDVISSIVQMLQADRANLVEPAYNVHGFYADAGQIATEIAKRVNGFTPRFTPDPMIENLIRTWPNALDSRAAARDWGWQPGFDLAATAAAMFDLLGDKASA
jgi:threonine 3-dehydrogenase